jgi:hypothetical protein
LQQQCPTREEPLQVELTPAPSTRSLFKENVIVYYEFGIVLPRNNDMFWGLNSRSNRWGQEGIVEERIVASKVEF